MSHPWHNICYRVDMTPSEPNALIQLEPAPAPTRSWLARLTLDFGPKRMDHQHFGPLRIQKALYPEGPSPCHAIIVHPPGGIAGGDRLEILLHSRAQSHGLVTTPSAAKWYGADAHSTAFQQVDIRLEGSLEWLPQETIVFDHAFVESDIAIRVSAEGAMIGWDHLIFGRKASGETFKTGRFAQSLRVNFPEGLVWHDRVVLEGDDALFPSPIGLRGHHAFATIWAVLPDPQSWTEALLEQLREQNPNVAWTVLHPRLLVGRLLTEPVNLKNLLQLAWASLRPFVLKRVAVPPRLWAT